MRVVIVTLLLLMQYSYCFSCDCVTTVGLKEAKSVFEGKVIGIEKVEAPNIRYEIKFRIVKIIKGKFRQQTIVVNTPSLNAAGCGIPFSINDKYVVFTYLDDKKLYTDDCTETKKIAADQ